MIEQHQPKIEAVGNLAIGVLGITISMAEVTSFFQSLGIIAGSLLVCLQLFRSLKKK